MFKGGFADLQIFPVTEQGHDGRCGPALDLFKGSAIKSVHDLDRYPRAVLQTAKGGVTFGLGKFHPPTVGKQGVGQCRGLAVGAENYYFSWRGDGIGIGRDVVLLSSA